MLPELASAVDGGGQVPCRTPESCSLWWPSSVNSAPSYCAASKVKWGLSFPNSQKMVTFGSGEREIYVCNFLINVLWMSAPSIAGPNGNLVQDGVSFNKMNYLTIVSFNIDFLECPHRQDCHPRSSIAWTNLRLCSVMGDSVPNPTEAQARAQICGDHKVREWPCQRCQRSKVPNPKSCEN